VHFDNRLTSVNEIVILNKCDLPEHVDWKKFDALRISCATGEGFPGVEDAILARISKENLRAESTIAINTRHRDCLRRALESCARASRAQEKGESAEYVVVDLNEALRAIGEVIGLGDVEEILDSLFGQFCIGK
jgi:tRNA modification GTPase